MFIVITYDPLYFCGFSFKFPCFIDLGTVSFFFMSLPKNLSILFIFSKNLALSLLSSIALLVSSSFISIVIFIIFFLLLNFDFVCSFSSSFRFKVRLFTWKFSYSSGRLVSLYNSLLGLILLYSIDFGFLCFHFHVSRCFLISFFISSVTKCLFSILLFSLHVFVFFIFFLVGGF